MAPLEFEKIGDFISRAKVFGGWLVLHEQNITGVIGHIERETSDWELRRGSRMKIELDDVIKTASITFVPDPFFLWGQAPSMEGGGHVVP